MEELTVSKLAVKWWIGIGGIVTVLMVALAVHAVALNQHVKELKPTVNVYTPAQAPAPQPAPDTSNCPDEGSSGPGLGPDPYHMPSFGPEDPACFSQ